MLLLRSAAWREGEKREKERRREGEKERRERRREEIGKTFECCV
jgi:hypothetical protein